MILLVLNLSMASVISMMVLSVKLSVPAVMVPTAYQLIVMLLPTLTSTVSCFLLKREVTATLMNSEGFVSVASTVLIVYVLLEMLLQLPPPLLLLPPQLQLLQLLPLQLLPLPLLLLKTVLLLMLYVMMGLVSLENAAVLVNVKISFWLMVLQNFIVLK